MSSVRYLVPALFAGLLWGIPLGAQEPAGTIRGRVIDATTQQLLVGASVGIEGTQRATSTGNDGTFVLSGVSAGTHGVTARFIGYALGTQQVTVGPGQTALVEFSLQRQAVVLDEIVVTGYGSQRRVAITGSVASVNADEANVGVVTNANELIQGRVAGLQMVQNTGEPGAGVQLRIRGGTSIGASNEPLYVIDGVAISNLPSEAGGIGIGGNPSLPRNPLNLINPNDIESITVLKDAAAAAIYGARSANGVILIETKQGQRDRMTFEYDGYVSRATPARRLDVLNGTEYAQFVEDQIAAGNLPATARDVLDTAMTDWEDEVTRSAIVTNHNIAFSGGTASTQYRASLNYMNQEGVALSSGLERYQARLNGTHYAWDDRLQLRLNLTASHMDNDYVPAQDGGGFEGDVLQNMVQFNPTHPVTVIDPATGNEEYFEIGTGAQSVRNPVALAEQTADFAGTTRVLGNLRAQLAITPSVSVQLNVGADRSESTRRIYFPGASPVGAQWNGRAVQQSRELTSLTFQGLVNLSPNIGGSSDVELIGGYEINEFDRDEFSAEGRDFLTDAFAYNNLAAGNTLLQQNSYREDSRLVGFFTRLNYGYKDRYFLTGVLRYDGSSVFGADNKWGVFPAISASWRLSEEAFLQNSPFSDLRLRVGWGVQGNQAVDPYQSLLTLAPGDRYAWGDQAVTGVAPNRNPNPDLKWEKTSQVNVAIDYGLANNTISGSLEYYIKNTSDLLQSVVVPAPAPAERRLENIGEVRNTGIEATLNWLLINKRNQTWDLGLVFAAERNEVVDLAGEEFITTAFVSGPGQSGQVAQRILPGEPLGTFFGPEFVGVNAAGEQLFNDYDADGNLVGQTTTLGPEDFQIIGDANPDFTLGLRSGLRWGPFDVNLTARWEQGGNVFNNTALVYGTKSFALQNKNFLKSALADPTGIDQPAIYSSQWIEDRSFFRLQNLTLGYTFDLPSWISGAGNTARIYVSSDNLFLLTGYSGYDPEVHTDRGNLAVRGIDYLQYPRARTFTAGLRLVF